MPRYKTRRSFLKSTGLTAAGVGLAAAGCGTSDSTTSGKAGVVQVATIGTTNEFDKLGSIIKTFESKHSGVKVQYLPVQANDWDAFFSRILTLISAGKAPDIVRVDTQGLQLFAEKGLAQSLDDYVRRDKAEIAEYFSDVPAPLVHSMMYQGSLFQLPMDWNAGVMYTNTAVFQKAGLSTPAKSWTVEDFNTAVTTIKKTGPFGYAWVNRMPSSGWLPWLTINRGEVLERTVESGGEWLWDTFYADARIDKARFNGGWKWSKPVVSSSQNIETFEMLVELVRSGKSPKPSLAGSNGMQGQFLTNKLGMMAGGHFLIDGLLQGGMKAHNFDVQPFPKWQTQNHVFGTAGYMIMNSSKNKDAAWEYIKTVTSREGMAAVLRNPSGAYSGTPPRRSLITAQQYAKSGPANWKLFADLLDRFPDSIPLPGPVKSVEMIRIFEEQAGLIGALELSPKQGLDKMQKAFEEQL